MRFAKKTLSVLMSIVLVMGLMPLPAFAGEGGSAGQGLAVASGGQDLSSGEPNDLDDIDDLANPNDSDSPDDSSDSDDADDTDDTDDTDGSDDPDNETVYVTAPDFDQLESDHDYANNTDKSWVYTDESATGGLMVTFDFDTEVWEGDFIEIYDADDSLVGRYTGTELLGRTVSLPGSASFRIRLVSDAKDTYYGFRVQAVEAYDASKAISSISFEPASPCQVVEGVDGWEEYEDDDAGTYFSYRVPDLHVGDVIRVFYADGSEVEYACGRYSDDEDENYGMTGWRFASDTGGKIYPIWPGETVLPENVEFFYSEDQEESHWQVGSTHKLTVRYRHVECEVDVDVVANPVAEISYEPAEPYRLVKGIDGTWDYWDYDSSDDYGRFFEYNVPVKQPGDILRVTGNDGSQVEYVYGADAENPSYFTSATGERIDSEQVVFSLVNSDHENSWEPGNTEKVSVTYLTRKCEVDCEVAENPVAAIEYTPAEPYRFIAEMDRYLVETTSDDPDDFQYGYSVPDKREGDILAVHGTDGSVVDYTYTWDDEECAWCFISPSGAKIDSDNVWFYYGEDQSMTQWEAGETHMLSVCYAFCDCTIPVNIVQMESIAYTPANSYELMEGIDGYWDEDEEGQAFFHYSLSEKPGDVLSISCSDGITENYTCWYYWYEDDEDDEDGRLGFISESRGHIWGSVNFEFSDDDQRDNHWSPGEVHTLTISYLDKTCEIGMNIVAANSIRSIEYRQTRPFQLAEEVDGYWDTGENGEDYFYYYCSSPQEGDVLVVTGADGAVAEYAWDGDERCYRSESGDEIDAGDVAFSYPEDQWESHWAPGETHRVGVSYHGRSCEVEAEIVPSPVQSIEYRPVKPIQLVDEVNGYWDTDANGESYFKYWVPKPREGDVLAVTDEDGAVTEYTFVEPWEDWQSQSGDKIPGYDVTFRFFDDQRKSPWAPGETYLLTARYRGRTCDVGVELLPNLVKSIEYHPVNPLTVTEWVDEVYGEEGHYHHPARNNGDTLAVTAIDGVVTEYAWDESRQCYRSQTGNEIDQAAVELWYSDSTAYGEGRWSPGETHPLAVRYSGRTCKVEVKILPNPVKSIEYRPAEPVRLVEGVDGYWDTDEDGEAFFHYNVPMAHDGDALVVTSAEGVTTEYVYWENNQDDTYEWVFESQSKDKLWRYDSGREGLLFSLTGDQYSTHWSTGETHKMTISYHGYECEIDVTTVENPVKSIEYRQSRALQVVERLDGYWDTGENGEDYFYYYCPDPQEGDVLVVTRTDGAVAEYAWDGDERCYRSESGDEIDADDVNFWQIEDQWESHWALGETHRMDVRYHGRSCEVDVAVVQNPVQSIAFEPCSVYQLVKESDDYGDWTDSEDGDQELFYYYAPRFKKGDKLIVTGSDGVVTTYTYQRVVVGIDENGDENYGWRMLASDNTQFDTGELSFWSDQAEVGGWGVGQHRFTMSYKGRCCDWDVKVVQKLNLEDAQLTLSNDSYSYSGVAIEPGVAVKVNGSLVSLYNDKTKLGGYTVSYDKNIDAGTGSVTVRGTGDYEGEKTATFKITPVTLAGAVLSGVSDKVYTGQAQQQAPTVKVGSTTLVAGKDYTLSSSNNTNAGTATVTVEGKGNYTGKTAATFAIAPASIKNANVELAETSYTFDGAAKKPTVKTVGGKALKAGTDYKLTYSNNTNAGTAKATVKGEGNYTGTATATFTIAPADITGASLGLSSVDFAYNGKVQKPSVTEVGGMQLKSGVDYRVKYSNARSSKPGIYQMWVEGIGNYSGESEEVDYTIAMLANPVKIKVKTPSVKRSKVKKAKQTIAASKAFSIQGNKGGKVSYKKISGDKAVKVTSGGKVTVAKGTKKGTHTVKVKVSVAAKGSYAAVSKTVKLKVKVK